MESKLPGGVDAARRSERERLADERDSAADQREILADERERLADERERLADERETSADRRSDRLDTRERRLDDRARPAGGACDPARRRAVEKVQGMRVALTDAAAQLDRAEEELARQDVNDAREQQAVDRELAATERLAVRESAGVLVAADPDARLARLLARFLAAAAELADAADGRACHYDLLVQRQPEQGDAYRSRAEDARATARCAREVLYRLSGAAP